MNQDVCHQIVQIATELYAKCLLTPTGGNISARCEDDPIEKRAQQRIYQINPQAMLELEAWSKQLAQLWNQRFDGMDELIKVEKEKTQQTIRKDV